MSGSCRLSSLVLVLTCCAVSAWPKDYGKVAATRVADGVYLFTTTPYADVGFCGNSVAIISEAGVLVFDSGAIPETAETILSEIRKLTDKPVRYLVISHWHWDHWGGNQVFLNAFPDLQIITHQKNRQMMLRVEPRWNEKGLKQGLPQFVAGVEKQIAEAKDNHVPAERIRAAEERLVVDRNFLTQKQSLKKIYPGLTFSEEITLQLGSREVRILHVRAITPGDTYLYLPREKILITGDIVLDPYPYTIGGSYPAEWFATLNQFNSMQPAIVIPGHGEADFSGKLLAGNLSLFRALLQDIKNAKAKGQSVDQTADALNKKAASLAAMTGVSGEQPVNEFKSYFLNTFIRRAYRELNGPLGDLPDGLE